MRTIPRASPPRAAGTRHAARLAACALLVAGCPGEGGWSADGNLGADARLTFRDVGGEGAADAAQLDRGAADGARDAARDAARDEGPPDQAPSPCDGPACDADGDSIPAAEDCDDHDAAVGRSATRACASACGTGVERCTAGQWLPCDAPTTCDCTAGTPDRKVGCGNCGELLQSCVNGQWVDVGSCAGEGVCSVGQIQAGSCDGCSQQLCGDTCQWGPCTLRPGAQCEYQNGSNYRCCGYKRFQFCLPTCMWSTLCDPCAYCPC